MTSRGNVANGKSSPDRPKQGGGGILGLSNLPLSLLQVLLILGGGYSTFNLLPVLSDELRTKLWISASDANIYMDKWDYIHFGTSMMGAVYWMKKRQQMYLAAVVIFLVAIGFEVYEQGALCGFGHHPASCEPIYDTIKDLFTCIFGLLVALYYPPNGLDALGHSEVLTWNIAITLLSPHFWWWEFTFFPLTIMMAQKFHKDPKLVRALYFGHCLLRVSVQAALFGGVTLYFLGCLVLALCSIFVISFLMYRLEDMKQ